MRCRQPAGQRLNVLFGDRIAVLPAQEVFKQNFERFGQSGEIAQLFSGQRQAVVMVGFVFDL